MSEEGQTNEGAGSADASGSKGAFGSQGAPAKEEKQTLPEGISWREAISDPTVKDSPTIAQIKAESAQEAIDVMSKQLVNANRLIGTDKIPKLKSDATPEEKQAYFQEHFGAAKDKAEYDFGLPEDATDEVKEVAGLFQDIAFEKNLSPDQAKDLYSKVGEFFENKEKALKEAKEASIKEGLLQLQEELGDRYEQNLSLANMAAERFGGEELDTLLNENPEFANSPVLIKTFAKMAGSLMDAQFHNPNPASNAVPNVGAEIQAFETSPRWRELISKKDLSPAEEMEYRQMMERRSALYAST